jgi:hypothetical protein
MDDLLPSCRVHKRLSLSTCFLPNYAAKVHITQYQIRHIRGSIPNPPSFSETVNFQLTDRPTNIFTGSNIPSIKVYHIFPLTTPPFTPYDFHCAFFRGSKTHGAITSSKNIRLCTIEPIGSLHRPKSYDIHGCGGRPARVSPERFPSFTVSYTLAWSRHAIV